MFRVIDVVSPVKPAAEFLRMEEMRDELRRQVAALGGVNEFCRQRHIDSHAPVSLAMSGKRDVTEAVANACGFSSRLCFYRIRELDE